MRLIDADALKCELFKLMERTLEYEDNLDEVVPLIDNAPTVEMPKALGTVDENGNIKIELIRPQGEWIITDAYPHKVYCSVCYKTFADSKWEVWKDGSLPRAYCPNCGADMRGGAE